MNYIAFAEVKPGFALAITFDKLSNSVTKVLPATPNSGFGSQPFSAPFIVYAAGLVSFKVKPDVTLEQAIELAKSIDEGREPDFDLILWSSKRLYWKLFEGGRFKELTYIDKLKADARVLSAVVDRIGHLADIKSEYHPVQ